MTHAAYWRLEVERLVSDGQHARASAYIQGLIASSGDDERIEYSAELISLYISQSHYREAHAVARRVQARFDVRPWPNLVAVVVAHLLGLVFIAGAVPILRRILPRRKSVVWKHLDAILWGIYWQDLREATSHNIFTCLAATTPTEELKSYAFLCYTLALRGYATIGLWGVRRAIRQARKRGDRALLRSLLVWLGVAYQWSSRHADASAVHDEFEREFADAEPFFQIIGQASRLHGNFTELGPLETARALDKCFAVSFALKESRNHIQIYGAKAALLALEGRVDEAEVFLAKAAQATERNDNNLDRFIYHRMAAVARLNGGRLDEAEAALREAARYLEAFGSPAGYRQEMARLRAILRASRYGSWPSRVLVALGLVVSSLQHLSFRRFRRGIHIGTRIAFERHPSYWDAPGVYSYLKTQTFGPASKARQSSLEKVVLQLTAALLNLDWMEAAGKPDLAQLECRVGEAFPTAEVILGVDLQSCLISLKARTELSGGIIFNEQDDCLRAPCVGNRFFVGVTAPLTEGEPPVACGILLGEMDAVSQTVVEMGLRIILSQYAHALSAWCARSQALANQRNAAIAQTVQMLAHDVRRPFSLLRSGLVLLTGSKSPQAMRETMARLVQEVNRTLSQVDGLIADVMEVGSLTHSLIQEPASPESLIEAALGETFRIYPNADVEVTYNLQHAHMASVHVQKVARVFSNIVGNAIQAMGKAGKLWFRTRESSGFVEFCIGNSGSFIPPEILPKLFDAFFTSGKKGGTGLGLAIARKVVTAHGGKIWCESSKTQEYPAGKVEFFFTLPIAQGRPSKTTAVLPGHSRDVARTLLTVGDDLPTVASNGSVNAGDEELEAGIVSASQSLGRPLKIMVVDDEAIYRSALTSFLTRTDALAEAVDVVQAECSDDALRHTGGSELDLVVTDVDLGAGSLDGFELVRELRGRSGTSAMICVHSNRMCADDSRTAVDAGADAFLPKPMARTQLLKLILQAGQKALPGVAGPVQGGDAKPEIAVVEDNSFILESWTATLEPDALVHGFVSPGELRNRVEQEPGFLDRLALVVTDYRFDNSSADGLDVAHQVNGVRPDLPVLLSSDGEIGGEESKVFDKIIAKVPVSLETLQRMVRKESGGHAHQHMGRGPGQCRWPD